MRLGDVEVGQRYWLNDRQYLRINDDLAKLFNDDYSRTIVFSLDMESYKVMCHNKEYEVLLESKEYEVLLEDRKAESDTRIIKNMRCNVKVVEEWE